MVAPDEAHGDSKVSVTSQKAQQILQQYQQYKQSGGQTAPKSASTPPPSQSVQSARPTVTPQINISQAQLQRTNAVRAQQDLPPLQEVENVRVVQPTHTVYGAGPQPERVATPNKIPDAGVLTGKSAQITKAHDTINQITTDFQAAKDAGVKEIQVKDSNGNVIGTVNPQNVPQARLQYLNMTKGNGSYEFSGSKSETQTEVTSTLITYHPENIRTAFAGGALGGFAEVGLIGLGLVAKATGKEITIPGTGYTAKPTGVLQQAQEKVQKTFGKETLDKMISGEKVDFSNPLELASLTGLGASIIATGGVGGVKAVVSAPSRIVTALRSPSIAKTIFTKEFQEGASLSQLQKVKGSSTIFEMEQASIQKAPKQVKETIQVQRLPSGKVQAVKVQTPIETSTEITKEPSIVYGVTGASSKGITSLVTKVTEQTPQEVAIKGLPLEIGVKMGLERLPNTGGFPIFAGKITSKNIPILMEEISKGNIKPTFDILQYPTKDIAKGEGRYGLLSRNENIMASNAFEKVTRPSIIRYFESKVELEKEVKPQGARVIKPSSKTSGVRGQKLTFKKEEPITKLTKEEKQVVQTVTKKEVSGQTANLKTESLRSLTRQGGKTILVSGGKTSQQEETTYLTTPKGFVAPKTTQRQTVIPISKGEGQTTKTKQTGMTGLVSKTTGITTTKQTSTVLQSQTTVQRQTQIPKTPPIERGTNIPDTTKRYGGLLPNLQSQSGGLGRVGKGGSRRGYVGNVPLTSITGIYNRSEISYGKVKTPKAPKPAKLSNKSKQFRL